MACALSWLPRLRTLKVAHTSFCSDYQLPPSIKHLDVSHTGTTDRELSFLSTWNPQLREVRRFDVCAASGVFHTDSFLFICVAQLVLDGNHVTKAGVAEFVEACSRLRYLSVQDADMPLEQSDELEKLVASRGRPDQNAQPSPDENGVRSSSSPSVTSVDDGYVFDQGQDVASTEVPSYGVREMLKIATSHFGRLRPPDLPEISNVTLGVGQTNSVAIDQLAHKLLSERET